MFLIRSMTTTDYAPQFGQYPKPYHIYLKPPGHRSGAYWTAHKFDAQSFATEAEAVLEASRVLHNWRGGPAARNVDYEVVPHDDRNIPTYWENQSKRALETKRIRETARMHRALNR
jgi:hypothetical protein